MPIIMQLNAPFIKICVKKIYNYSVDKHSLTEKSSLHVLPCNDTAEIINKSVAQGKIN